MHKPLLPSLVWAVGSLLSLNTVTIVAQNTTAATNDTITASPANSTADCQCGFLDPTTNSVYTDSIIVYFNETNTSVPTNIFSIDSFQHPYERGFEITYREGASAENVFFTQGSAEISPSWLTLNITAASPQHLVSGAQIQTVRQDIQYGTFRVFMRGPAPYAGGSALSMKLEYNDTSSAELDLLNMDDSHDDARMAAAVGGSEPLSANNVSYWALQEEPYNVAFWNFTEYRMDWNEQLLLWYANGVQAHNSTTSNASLVDVPASFYLKHWSNGDPNWMQGPPTNDTSAAIGWVRMFFNSSITESSQSGSLNCDAAQLCSTEDTTLRVSTSYTKDSTTRPTISNGTTYKWTMAGVILMAASFSFSTALVMHAIISKSLDAKRTNNPRRPKLTTSPFVSPEKSHVSRGWSKGADYEMDMIRHRQISSASLLDVNPASSPEARNQHKRVSAAKYPLLDTSSRPVSTVTTNTSGYLRPESTSTLELSPNPYYASSPRNSSVYEIPGFDKQDPFLAQYYSANDPRRSPDGYGSRRDLIESIPEQGHEASPADPMKQPIEIQAVRDIELEGSAAAANPGAKPAVLPSALPQGRTRVDYLAGLVAVCSLLVSCTHFILTFVPSVIEEYLDSHYQSESWARKTIEPFFFNDIWVGLFFTTSTRFLSSGFLRTGNLNIIAEKVVCRCPRLMIPITAVILFEYFLMDLGATTYLEYIPSITWTDWVSTTVYPNFGWFLDETLQLFYIIPNVVPQLTWNYCTGVLWTIPVQLQNSWVVLLGAVVIREIKTPWKRMAYYAFCVVNHWYGQSWGSYFWMGLLLADLDITYKYRKWLHARWYVHYPMLVLAILLVLLSLGVDLISIWTGWNFASEENGVHPDMANTALPIGGSDYPTYVTPKLNGLVFAVASQYIVELSTWVQTALSTPIFLWLFPHVFTIYLIHGLIFWSIGSLVCVYFAGIGLAYWLNILLTALISYATLFAVLPIVTPVMEMLGKEITRGIWIGASEDPADWKPSSFPLSVEEIRCLVHRADDD
ncbi:Hypothetical protein R9X50_00186200 [Acrodontium crateriforme]|uniref:GH16 domain-containing protein n=1 Tax=Acrodontium crateriforme TaxID=150365 RepID=A0AAQ3M0F9_9PEZI|nr:Hypothetical protein R9X50_00186200 [Acrodontium crateriforme]